MRIGIIIGSTRPRRRGDAVAQWVYKLATQRGDATYEIVDLAEFDLPHLDEPTPAAKGPQHYERDHTKRWAATVASYDGFVFVTSEYNHSVAASLKNAIDFLYAEWRNKSAGFVGYGLSGATRAVEHLRQIMAELHVADVRDQVALSLFTEVGDHGEITPADHQEALLHRMLDQVVAWAGALKTLRQT